MAAEIPLFYDCEASGVEGYPIEIGWASADPKTGDIVSESHLIRPPEHWPIRESWDRAAERKHGIALSELWLDGRQVSEIAARMNATLDGRELFSDDRHDQRWLGLLFEAARLEPTFSVHSTDAKILISRIAADCGMDQAAYARAMASATELARDGIGPKLTLVI